MQNLEAALRALFFGQASGGVFGALRRFPRSPAFTGEIGRNGGGAIVQSSWWADIWSRLRDRALPLATKISRDAGSAAWREFAAGFAEERARELAVDFARSRAKEILGQVEATTVAGVQQTAFDLSSKDLALAQLREELAARIGPTPKQLARIRLWEAAQRAAGIPAGQIAAGVRARILAAIRMRADAIAAQAFMEVSNNSLMAVYAEEGLLVYSASVPDDRRRELHRIQTVITLANPKPAGQPWAPGAPFRGPPPYEIFCRCRPRVAGRASIALAPGADLSGRPAPDRIL